MCVFFPAFPPLQCCSRGVNVFNRASLLGALQSRWCGAFAAGSPRGSWRSMCKPPLQKRSVALHWGGSMGPPCNISGVDVPATSLQQWSAANAHIPLPNTAAQRPFQLSHWSGKDGTHANQEKENEGSTVHRC